MGYTLHNNSFDAKRTAFIPDWAAFLAWLDTQPLIVAANGGNPHSGTTAKQAVARASKSQPDSDFAAALKSMA